MDEKTLFTNFWNNEAKTTRNVLSRIPEGSDYRPDPKSRTAHEIAWQIVCEEKMLMDALETGKVEWSPAPTPTTMKEVVETYATQCADLADRWESLPAERWNGELDFFGSKRPASPMAWSSPLRHRPPPRPNNDVPAADGIESATDLRTKRRRTVKMVAGLDSATRLERR
jgi:hypothetical protein